MEKLIAQIDELNLSAYRKKLPEPDKSRSLAQQVQDILRFATPYQKGWMDNKIILTWQKYFAGDFTHSFSVARRTLAWYEDTGDRVGEMWSLYLMGISCRQMGDWHLAMKCHLRQLEIAEQIGEVEDIAEAHNIMGLICTQIKEYEHAKEHLEIANELFKSLGNFYEQIIVYGNSMYQGMLLNDYDMIISMDEAARDLQNQSPPSDSKRAFSHVLWYLGQAYAATGNYDKAMMCFNESIAISEIKNYAIEKVLGRVYLGECYKWQGKFEDALEILQEALTLTTNIPISHAINKCHQLLTEIYEAQDNMELAYKHLKLFQQMQEKVLLEQSRNQLQYQQLLTTFEKVQFRNQLLHQQRENDKAYFDTLSKVRNDAIATARHDLNNPLTVIMLNVDKLRRYGTRDTALFERSLRNLEKSTENMHELITKLLDIAKLETGRSLHIETVSLTTFIEDIIQLMKMLAEEKNIQLKSIITSQIQNASFDAFRIRQALDNLISNAIKYSGDGGQITVHIEDDSKHLIFHVKDTGFRIPEKHLPQLFERFYRVDEDEHATVSGTGLGLSIVKTIIEQHGGTIWVTSEQGRGSIFSFAIPLNIVLQQDEDIKNLFKDQGFSSRI